MKTFKGKLQLDFGDFTNATTPEGYNINLGKYALLLSDIEWMNDGIHIKVPAGSYTDGTSIPKSLDWILPKWGDISTVAAIVHDYILDRILDNNPCKGLENRVYCDWQYYQMLLALKVSWWRSTLAWIGVRANSISYELIGWPPQRAEYIKKMIEGNKND